MLQWIIEWLEQAGYREVVLCLGYRAEVIQEFVMGLSSRLHFDFSIEPDPLGTGGALRWALPRLKEEMLVVNGDTLFDTNLAPVLKLHKKHAPLMTMVLTQKSDTRRYGKVEIGRDYRILKFEEKGQSDGPGWVSAGLYLMQRTVVESHVPAGPVSLERDVLPQLVEEKAALLGLPLQGQFFDVGTPEGYREANQAFARRHPEPTRTNEA